jgi:hypothetical protein
MISCCSRDRIESSVLLGGGRGEGDKQLENLNERRVKWEGAKRRKLPGTGAKRLDKKRRNGREREEEEKKEREEK